MKNKYFACFIVFMLMFSSQVFASPAIAVKKTDLSVSVEKEDTINNEFDIIKKVSLKNKFQKSSESQINSFLKKYNKYSQKNNLKKLKEMYCENFVNNDGFDRETVFKMMEMAAGSYKNVKYDTEIKEIKAEGKYAVVKASETVTAQTDSLSERIKDTGIVVSKTDYIDYLVKEGNDWKIQANEIIAEEVSMKYGEAKNMDIEITAPQTVPSGTSYEVSISANTPDGTFALGSIVNEKIIFPQEENKDVFRAIKSEKLARVLTSNKEGFNEYTTVSIALTRAEVEPNAVNINMTGAAFAMRRINVIPFSNMTKKEEANAKK